MFLAFSVWPVVAVTNAVIALCYFAIAWVVVRGLLGTNQMRTNALGVATALIFITCAVHHGAHAVHLFLPLVADDTHGLAMRDAFTWQMAVWDIVGVIVASVYLSLRSSFGRLLQTPAMFEDIARARADEVVKKERAALAEAQSVGRMGSWQQDLEGAEGTVSEEFRRIFGLRADEDTDEIWAWIGAEERAAIESTMQRARDGADGEVTYPWHRPGADVRWAHLRVRAERDETGQVVGIGGTVQDVTERTLMEEALRDAERRFRTAFDGAPIGAMLISLDDADRGRIRQVNPAFAELVGLAGAELEDMSLADIVLAEDYPLLEGKLDHLADADLELERRLVHSTGQPVWTLLSAALLEELGAPTAVLYAVDISERKQFEGQLQYLADHDALTGLQNRRRFAVEVERALKNSHRFGESGAIVILDLDGFKFINDSLGHAAGDELITRVSALLGSTLRETDLLARVGGDEFAVLLPRCTPAEAEHVADKICCAVRARSLSILGRPAKVSISAGVAPFAPDDELTADELLVEADIAMYEAKEAGRDRYAVYAREENHRARIAVRENWNQRLRGALADDAFVLHAQPIVPLATRAPGGVPAYELLLRLPDGHGDLIPPGTFLYNAERFDLMEQIDRWVLAEGVRLLAESHGNGVDVRLSVNVSGTSMGDSSLADYVAALLAPHDIPRDRLVIEITETAAITNVDGARTLAKELRELGCGIALDDFGAGFASFYYLKHLGFDYLKIDGEFIRNLHPGSTDQLVVKAVVDIARGLGALTIAEFVGDQQTTDLVRELGVDYGQGFFLGRPQPLSVQLPHLGQPQR